MMLWYTHHRPFVVTEPHLCDDWVDGCIVHSFHDAVLSFHAKNFLYVDVGAASAASLAKTLLQSGRTGVISAREPDFLDALWQLECKTFRLALRVATPKELQGLEHCPYDAVEIAEPMATHELIWRTHQSGKEVYVRISKDNREIRNRRIIGLTHEKVDVLIAETGQVLAMVKSAIETGA